MVIVIIQRITFCSKTYDVNKYYTLVNIYIHTRYLKFDVIMQRARPCFRVRQRTRGIYNTFSTKYTIGVR